MPVSDGNDITVSRWGTYTANDTVVVKPWYETVTTALESPPPVPRGNTVQPDSTNRLADPPKQVAACTAMVLSKNFPTASTDMEAGLSVAFVKSACH